MDSLDILGHTFGRLGFVIGVGSGDYHDEDDGWMGRGCFGTVAGYYNKLYDNNYYHNLSPQVTTTPHKIQPSWEP